MPLRGRNKLTDEHFFFVTTTVFNFINVFTTDIFCDHLIRNIKHYQKKYKFEIIAYAIMPSHFHWIVYVDSSKGTISDIMRDIKKYSAWDILEQLKIDRSQLIRYFQHPIKEGQIQQFWMHRFDDRVIRDQKMLWSIIKYIHNNPVEEGIVEKPEDYKYSSARNYIIDDQSLLFVEKSWAGGEMI